MDDGHGQWTVERKDLVEGGDLWVPIESSWECHNPLVRPGQAKRVARTLALRADGDAAYRVVGADLQVLATYQVAKTLLITHPGAPERVVPVTLPPGMAIPMVSAAVATEHEHP